MLFKDASLRPLVVIDNAGRQMTQQWLLCFPCPRSPARQYHLPAGIPRHHLQLWMELGLLPVWKSRLRLAGGVATPDVSCTYGAYCCKQTAR